MTAQGSSHSSRHVSVDFPLALLAGLIVLVGAAAVGKVAEMLSVHSTIASVVGQATIPAGPLVYGYLQRRRGTMLTGVVSISGFAMAPSVMTLLGALVIVGIANLGSIVGVLLAGDLPGALAVSVIAAVTASFLVGRWIGIRASSHALLATVGAVVLARILGTTLDFMLVSDDVKAAVGLRFSFEYGLAAAMGAALWLVAGLSGSYVGRRSQEAEYVSHLMRKLDAQTRRAVVEMVYDESRRALTA